LSSLTTLTCFCSRSTKVWLKTNEAVLVSMICDLELAPGCWSYWTRGSVDDSGGTEESSSAWNECISTLSLSVSVY